MGYSNNKWRKILTILMIINLCFILFAKITKSFGAFTVNYDNIELPINDSLINNTPYYAIFASDTLYQGSHYFWLVRSNAPIEVRVSSSGSTRLTALNRNKNGMDAYLAQGQGFINYLNNTTFNTIENDTWYKYASGIDSNWSCAYTNHDIKNYDNPNEILFPDNSFTAPYFDNLTEIENGYPDGVFISRGSYSADEPLYFHLLKITNTVPDGNQSTYYYDSKVFKLTKDSKYYRTYDADTENKYSYYNVERSALTLDTNSSYLYVLSNSGNSITNSYGILQPDVSGGIYDVVESDTAGVITEQQALNDKIANINNNQQEIANNSNNINNYLNENTISNNTAENIDTNMNFNNNAPEFSSIFNGFFSRLTSTISDLGNYQDSDVITVYLPIPFTNDTIPIRSDIIFSNQNNNFLRNITTLLWYFIFGRYFLYFLINTYWLITNGQFFDNYLTQKEVISGDML